MSQKTDMRHGRQGGRFLPDDYEAIDFSNTPTCEVCDLPMILGQKNRHYFCDPESMVGDRCTCRPGCTVELVGDGPVDCDVACRPCHLQMNQLYSEVKEWRRFR